MSAPIIEEEESEIGVEVVAKPVELIEANRWGSVDIYRTDPVGDFPKNWSFVLQVPSNQDIKIGREVDCWIRSVNPKTGTVETSRRSRDVGFDTMRDRYLEAAETLVDQCQPSGPDLAQLDVEILGQAKGMLTRCIKKDQSDWYTVYALLGKPTIQRMKRGRSAIERLQDAVRDHDEQEASAAIHQLDEYEISRRYNYFIRRVNSGLEYKALTRSKLLRQLHQIDSFRFEHFIADILESDGWETQVTDEPYYEKRGVDLIATKNETGVGLTMAVQIKRYDPSGGRHGTTDIRSYNSIEEVVDDADISAMITTGEFTDDASYLAQETGLKLIDGEDLIGIIDAAEAYDIVEEYIS